MKTWSSQHYIAAISAWLRLWQSPLNTTLALLVIGLTLSLPGGAYVFLDKLSALSERAASAQQISVFMALDASPQELSNIEGKLKQHAWHFRLVGKDAAWQEMQSKPGMSDVLVGLTRNPLPDAFVVDVGAQPPEIMEKLRTEFLSWPRIAHVQIDVGWVQRLDAILRLGRLGVSLLTVLFGAGLVAVIFNTIRLQVLAQAEEIEVSRLIGATNAFIRRPFTYLGFMQGFLGGLLAVFILSLTMMRLEAPVAEIVALYGGEYSLGRLLPEHTFALLGGGGLLGWIGAWLAVSLSLRQIND